MRGKAVAIVPREGFEPESEQNPFVSYNCIRVAREYIVVGNGTHTDLIAGHLDSGMNGRDALCAELLLHHGADVNARAQILQDGSGGQTSLYHAIGTPRGSCSGVFDFLVATTGPDLTVRACLTHNGRIREFTPLGYALARLDFYSRKQPVSRQTTAREIERLRQLGAPE